MGTPQERKNAMSKILSEEHNLTDKKYPKKGFIWVCVACGKVSYRDRYGEESAHRDWDEACIVNAVEVEEASCNIQNDIVVSFKN